MSSHTALMANSFLVQATILMYDEKQNLTGADQRNDGKPCIVNIRFWGMGFEQSNPLQALPYDNRLTCPPSRQAVMICAER
jgi:hypothetical protein